MQNMTMAPESPTHSKQAWAVPKTRWSMTVKFSKLQEQNKTVEGDLKRSNS